VVGSVYTIVAVGTVGLLLAARRRHDRRSGAALVGIYLLSYLVLLAVGGVGN
jgi:hypothetical protein